MTQTKSTTDIDRCPECDTSKFYINGAAFWCENCQREYWPEASGWWSCDVTGVPERV